MKTTYTLSLIISLSILFSCSPKAVKNSTDSTINKYQLVWADEFDTNGKPDQSKWTYELGFVRANEKQYYTDSLNNARVENGTLIIEARKEKIKIIHLRFLKGLVMLMKLNMPIILQLV